MAILGLMVLILSPVYWPKAIHEGNGTAQLFITNKANEEQRQAIINIVSGQAKGDGPFALFAGTFKYFLEPQIVDIKVNLNGKKSSFSVPGVMDVQTESFTNPVTGEDQDTKIQLPNLLEYLERRVGCASIVLYLPYLHQTLCHVNSIRLSKKLSSDHETFVP
jgi:hypothetical protein